VWPRLLALISLFIGTTRLLAVPLLFSVAGFSSQFAMVMHGRSPSRFALRRTCKSALTIVFNQAFAYLAKLARPLPPAVTAATTPYYASCDDDILAVLNGPTSYILVVFALDYMYAVFCEVNMFTSSSDKPSNFITTKARYRIAKLLFIGVECWMLAGVQCSWLIG
jgi:hypothetical protein